MENTMFMGCQPVSYASTNFNKGLLKLTSCTVAVYTYSNLIVGLYNSVNSQVKLIEVDRAF